MIEKCPFCQNEVLFTSSVCPSCRNDRELATPEAVALMGAEVARRQEEVAARQAATARQDAVRNQAQMDMMVGAAWAVGGFVVTLVSHANAAYSGGGTYLMMWGPWIYGGFRFLRGAYTMVFSPLLR